MRCPSIGGWSPDVSGAQVTIDLDAAAIAGWADDPAENMASPSPVSDSGTAVHFDSSGRWHPPSLRITYRL
jgi:hypothetical protein